MNESLMIKKKDVEKLEILFIEEKVVGYSRILKRKE
jgi:hypothetical protein